MKACYNRDKLLKNIVVVKKLGISIILNQKWKCIFLIVKLTYEKDMYSMGTHYL